MMPGAKQERALQREQGGRASKRGKHGRYNKGSADYKTPDGDPCAVKTVFRLERMLCARVLAEVFGCMEASAGSVA